MKDNIGGDVIADYFDYEPEKAAAGGCIVVVAALLVGLLTGFVLTRAFLPPRCSAVEEGYEITKKVGVR